jgi:serine/threonine protein kinase
MTVGPFTTDVVLSPKKNSTVLLGSFHGSIGIDSKQVVLKKLHGIASDVEKEMNNCRLVQQLMNEKGGKFVEIIALGVFEDMGSWDPRKEASICMRRYDMDLDTWIMNKQNEEIPSVLVQSWCTCVTSTMVVLHDAKMLHLDLKPQNLLWDIDTPDSLFLCDFGSMVSAVQPHATTQIVTIDRYRSYRC